ncbi:MAG: restriction endonuclease subunit S [Eubacterium sp.]|uniref:restriction endonuclease subunit S n=1 Tax=Eubacterium sp. TaxID=142586 RepID=UPI00300E753F
MMDTKALRQKILDLAIRGKLVPQDPNDEPASVLLERIREQKKKMVEEGKLKPKDIKKDSIIFLGEDNLHYEKFQDGTVKCIEDEIPFELPEGWAWCRFMSITVNRDSKRKPISSANRTNVAKIYDYYGASGKIDKIDKFIFNEKLLLIGEDGANLITRSKPIAFFAEGQYWVNNHAHCIDSTDKLILEYLCLYINAISLEKYVTGSAQPKMTQDNMNSILIALPPYEEQKRLEFQVNHILKTVSTIENEKEDIVNYIVSAKSKILELAIRGKLVPQAPNDEPASVLLERIRAEKEELIKQGKIKRNKKESFIFRGDDNSYYEKIGDDIESIDAEILFKLPDNWIWCRGYSCFSGMESTKPQGEYFDYIDIDSIDNKSHCVKKTKHIPVIEAPSRASRAINSGSVLFSLVRPYLENIALIEEIHSHSIASTGFYVCNSNGLLLSEYMFYLMISKYVVDGLNQYMKGDNSPSISKNDIENWLYPIPPITEQKRICYILKSTYTIIEKMEESLI